MSALPPMRPRGLVVVDPRAHLNYLRLQAILGVELDEQVPPLQASHDAVLSALDEKDQRIAELEHIAELAMEWAANFPYVAVTDQLAADTIYKACERAGIGQPKEAADENPHPLAEQLATGHA